MEPAHLTHEMQCSASNATIQFDTGLTFSSYASVMPLGLPDLRDGLTLGGGQILLGTPKAKNSSHSARVNTAKALKAAWEVEPTPSHQEVFVELLDAQ
jgi:hypothetical protein